MPQSSDVFWACPQGFIFLKKSNTNPWTCPRGLHFRFNKSGFRLDIPVGCFSDRSFKKSGVPMDMPPKGFIVIHKIRISLGHARRDSIFLQKVRIFLGRACCFLLLLLGGDPDDAYEETIPHTCCCRARPCLQLHADN